MLVALGILVVLALVILPFKSTLIVGIPVEVPYDPLVTPVFVSVPVAVMLDVPSKLGLV